MTTGELIKKHREAAKLTQSELAVRIGTTPQNISQYERELRNPKLETVQRIADAIGVDIYSLLDFDQSDNAAPPISSENEKSGIRTVFAERLKSLRDQKGWSQQRLADELGISKSSVNMYERSEREPGFEIMQAIADIFNVDMNYLHGKSDPCETASKEAFSHRLTDRMAELQLRQVDLLEKIRQCCSIKVTKSDLSQYVAGKVIPGPEKLYALSVALEVNECWLLGYNDLPAQTGDTSHSIRFAVFGAPCTDAQFEEVCRFARYILWRDSQK